MTNGDKSENHGARDRVGNNHLGGKGTSEPTRAIPSPLRLLTVTALSIFGLEGLILWLLSVLPPLSPYLTAVVDALLLTSVIFPGFYFFLFRPIILYADSNRKVVEMMQEYRDELEIRVSERTAELTAASEALGELEKRFRSVAVSATDAIIVADSRGTIIQWNKAARTIFGFSENEALGKSLTLLMPKRFHDPHMRGIERFLSTGRANLVGKTTELTGMRKDGSEFFLELSLTSWKSGSEINFLGIVRDVTKRKQAEQSLRESEERYYALFERVPVGLYRTTPSGKILDANPFVVQILGYPNVDSFLGITTDTLYPNPLDRRRWQMLMDNKKLVRDFEVQVRRSDGTLIWVRDNARLVQDADGEALYYEGTLEDITEFKRIEEERDKEVARKRIAEKKYRDLLENAPDAIVVSGSDGRISLVNQGVVALFGYERDELLGRPIEMLIPERSRSHYVKQWRDYYLYPRTRGMRSGLNIYGLRKNGSEFNAEISLSQLMGYEGPAVTSIIRDVTERKQAEHEREKLVLELQDALANVKTLSGLLPICASCKKVRDDKGYWSQIESYITQRSEATFSHGLCPKCAKTLYPDYFKEDRLDGNRYDG